MKKFKALTGFSGIISMAKNEVKELDEKNLQVRDLVKAGLISEVKPPTKTPKKK